MPLIAREKEYTPSSASKDVTILSDGRHTYWLGSFSLIRLISSLSGPDGAATYRGQYTLAATKTRLDQPGVYDLGGIAQYDLK